MTKTVAFKPLTSWSFSRWGDYVKCPALFKYKHIDKLPEPKSPAIQRGIDIHAMCEQYLTGKISRLPAELKQFKDEFPKLKKQRVKFVEENWAFTNRWDLTTWNDWNNCWVRVKLDVAYIHPEHSAIVPIDFKTGRPRPEKTAEYELQLELYGLASLLQQTSVQVSSPRLWYLDTGEIYPNPDEREIEYTREDIPSLQKKWQKRVEPMFKDKQFKPTPGDACRWCHYRKSNGGPCKY